MDYLEIRELYHHGIKGQKWGDRNGPPYPLDYEDHSSAEKKSNLKSKLDNYATKVKKSRQVWKKAAEVARVIGNPNYRRQKFEEELKKRREKKFSPAIDKHQNDPKPVEPGTKTSSQKLMEHYGLTQETLDRYSKIVDKYVEKFDKGPDAQKNRDAEYNKKLTTAKSLMNEINNSKTLQDKGVTIFIKQEKGDNGERFQTLYKRNKNGVTEEFGYYGLRELFGKNYGSKHKQLENAISDINSLEEEPHYGRDAGWLSANKTLGKDVCSKIFKYMSGYDDTND